MLNKKIQEDLIELVSIKLEYINEFEKMGLKIDEKFFTGVNKKRIKILKSLNTEGYDSLTRNHAVFYEMELPFNKKSKNDFLDLSKGLRANLEEIYYKEMKEQLDKTMKSYDNSSFKERLELKKEMTRIVASSGTTMIKDDTKDVYDVIDEKFIYEEGAEKIPSYLRELDSNILKGGFTRKGIHVISGFPGNGKTTAGVQFGVSQAASGYKVLFLSLEQLEEDITTSILAILSELDDEDKVYWDIGNITELNEKEMRGRGKELVEKHLQGCFMIDDTKYKDQEELLYRLNRAIYEEKYDVIMMDNFQNAPQKQGQNAEQSYSQLAEEILQLVNTKESNTAFLALSQLTLSNGKVGTKYSKRLNENAVTNLTITRPEKKEDDVDDVDKIEIYSEKARKGKQGVTEVFNFIGEKGIIGSFGLPVVDHSAYVDFREAKQGKIKERGDEEAVMFNVASGMGTIEEVKQRYDETVERTRKRNEENRKKDLAKNSIDDEELPF